MIKYAVYSQKLKKFYAVYQGKGLYYEDSDFGDLEKVRLYKKESTATDQAMNLYAKFDTVVVPVELIANITSAISISEKIKKTCDEYLPTVLGIDKLDAIAVEKVSNKDWSAYKKQRAYLRTYCDDYTS